MSGFEEDDTEWVPLSPFAKVKSGCPLPPATPNLSAMPDDDEKAAPDTTDDGATSVTRQPPAQANSEFDTSVSTPTKCNGTLGESSRWITASPEKHIPTPTPNAPNGRHSKAAVAIEPTPQLLPAVHRYRGPLTIGSSPSPRHYNIQGCNHHFDGSNSKSISFDKLSPTTAKAESPRNALRITTVKTGDAVFENGEMPRSPFRFDSTDDERKQESVVTAPSTTDDSFIHDAEDIDSEDDEVVFVGDIHEIPLPPPVDMKLVDLTNIVAKRLVGISIQDYYDACWSDLDGATFYKSWLQNRGNTQVKVHNWKYAKRGDQPFVGSWCGETYTQQRLVTFQYQRMSDLHSGSLDADIHQLQMCRRESGNRIVITMQTDTHGIPFADHFQIHVRWNVTNILTSGQPLLSVQVGVVVKVVKPTLIAAKLQSELIQETTAEQWDLFKSIKKSCTAWTERLTCREVANPIGFRLPLVLLDFLKLQNIDKIVQPKRGIRGEDVQARIRKAEEQLRHISAWLEQHSSSSETRKLDDARNQLDSVNQMLDRMIAKLEAK